MLVLITLMMVSFNMGGTVILTTLLFLLGLIITAGASSTSFLLLKYSNLLVCFSSVIIFEINWYFGFGDMLHTVTMSFRSFRQISNELRDSPPNHLNGCLYNNLACCSAKSGMGKSGLLSD